MFNNLRRKTIGETPVANMSLLYGSFGLLLLVLASDCVYVGHPLVPGTAITIDGGKAVHIYPVLPLKNGTLTSFRFRSLSRLPAAIPTIPPFRLQIFHLISAFPLKARLILEKRVVLDNDTLGQIVEIPLCGDERIKVNTSYRLGLSNEGDGVVLAMNTDYDFIKKDVVAVEDFPAVGDLVNFALPFPLPGRYSFGVTINETVDQSKCKDTDTGIGPTEPEEGSSESISLQESNQDDSALPSLSESDEMKPESLPEHGKGKRSRGKGKSLHGKGKGSHSNEKSFTPHPPGSHVAAHVADQ